MFVIEIKFGTPYYDQAIDLRYRLLRLPLNMQFKKKDLEIEFDQYHFCCFDNAFNLLGTATFKALSKTKLKMRQVAIDFNTQSKGVGSFLIHEMEKWAIFHDFQTIELNARDTAFNFYKKNKYVQQGDLFSEVGVQHRKFTKKINKSNRI